MIQNLIVALIVGLAVLYVAARYLPARLRERIVYALARRGFDQARMARWFNTAAGCGSGCDTCKSCEDPAPAPAAEQPTGHRVIKLHQRR